MKRTFVIVGAGACGLAAADALRRGGFDGRVVVVGDEPYLPYERPPLSKAYLRGEKPFLDLFFHTRGFFDDNDIELLLGRSVFAIEPREKKVELSGGRRLGYDSLLLATGGAPRRLDGPSGARVLYLRSIDDADRVRRYLRSGGHLIVVGAGFIGAEVAASARSLGLEVTMLEVLQAPLVHTFGPEIGRLYASIHSDHGVRLRTEEGVVSIEQGASGVVVHTTKGDAIEGDAVVVGIGISPNSGLAAAAGLAMGNGIVVDEFCRTSDPAIFAAGDVAEHYHPVFERRVRVEHFDNAARQGAAAAAAMLGSASPYDHPHWFWSDQYDYNLQFAGVTAGWDTVVVRGSMEEREFVAFYLEAGVLRAALGVNRGRDVRRALKLIRSRAAPDPAVLADESLDLRDLARPRTA